MGTTLGSNIKAFRKNKGFTQEELAGLLNITPQAVSKWESGQSMPDIQLMPRHRLRRIQRQVGFVMFGIANLIPFVQELQVFLMMRREKNYSQIRRTGIL